MTRYNKDRKRLLSAARRMRFVIDDTRQYFEKEVMHVDDFKVLLTFFRSCHKWSEMLSFVAMCDELTCHKMSQDGLIKDLLIKLVCSIDCLGDKKTTQGAADTIYSKWPLLAESLDGLTKWLFVQLKDAPFDITALAVRKNEIAKYKKTRTIAEHKYDAEKPCQYEIPVIEWAGIVKDGKMYFADDEDLWDKNLYELCMIVSARMSRLYVELVNKAIPMAHATMAFDETQARFDMSCNAVKLAFETEIKNGSE